VQLFPSVRRRFSCWRGWHGKITARQSWTGCSGSRQRQHTGLKTSKGLQCLVSGLQLSNFKLRPRWKLEGYAFGKCRVCQNYRKSRFSRIIFNGWIWCHGVLVLPLSRAIVKNGTLLATLCLPEKLTWTSTSERHWSTQRCRLISNLIRSHGRLEQNSVKHG